MSKIPLMLGKKNNRSCDGCTKCCEGWLSSEINGETMYPGKPCASVDLGVGCTVYKDRPKEPCKTFECTWKSSDFVPEQFSPKNTGQIISTQAVDEIPYMALAYAGQEVSAELLSWFVTFAVGRQLNAEWSVDGVKHAVGSSEFIAARDRQHGNFKYEAFNGEKR